MNAAEWVDRAIRAGHKPMVVIQPDGVPAIQCSQIRIDRKLSPPPFAPEQFDEIHERLAAMGREVCAPLEVMQ